MLFILIMDVFSNLFKLAENEGLLQGLGVANIRSRLSLYADDVVFFIKPHLEDLRCAKMILECFGGSEWVETNMQKSCAIPIYCDAPLAQDCCNLLQCANAAFPCTYLGLPLSNKKLRRADLWWWVQKIKDCRW